MYGFIDLPNRKMTDIMMSAVVEYFVASKRHRCRYDTSIINFLFIRHALKKEEIMKLHFIQEKYKRFGYP